VDQASTQTLEEEIAQMQASEKEGGSATPQTSKFSEAMAAKKVAIETVKNF